MRFYQNILLVVEFLFTFINFLCTLYITAITLSLLITCISKAEESDKNFAPTIELSTRNSKKRNIVELDYLQPLLRNENILGAIDLKLKTDNDRSKEINFGAVYRYNFDDNAILSVYGYFDHRRTRNKFAVNGFTPGIELLSKYVDLRANYYIPQNKRKKIRHNNKKQVMIQGTNIYAVSGGHEYEYALKGYDFEIGGPVFGFSDSLNDKFGTRLFVARYNFHNKHTKKVTGTRFRLEQKLGRLQLNDNALYFNLNAETQFDKVRKRQNFIGISAKFAFGEKTKPTGFKSRMMDTVIRDVDIVVNSEKAAPQVSNFMLDGREINKMYYVGSANSNYKGDGTKENPYSIEQLNQVNISDAIVIVTAIDNTKGGKAISQTEFSKLKSLPQVVNDKKEINLISRAEDSTAITIKGDNGIELISRDSANTTIITDFALNSQPSTQAVNQNNVSEATPKIVLLAPEVQQVIEQNVIAAPAASAVIPPAPPPPPVNELAQALAYLEEQAQAQAQPIIINGVIQAGNVGDPIFDGHVQRVGELIMEQQGGPDGEIRLRNEQIAYLQVFMNTTPERAAELLDAVIHGIEN